MSPERLLVTNLHQISDKVLVDLKTWLEPWFDFSGAKSAGPRLVYGSVFNDATILDAGTGDWTVEWTDHLGATGPANNYYTINFAPVFSRAPLVYLAGNNNNPSGEIGRYTVTQLHDPTTDYAEVITADVDDADSASQDGGFAFLAIEPPA